MKGGARLLLSCINRYREICRRDNMSKNKETRTRVSIRPNEEKWKKIQQIVKNDERYTTINSAMDEAIMLFILFHHKKL